MEGRQPLEPHALRFLASQNSDRTDLIRLLVEKTEYISCYFILRGPGELPTFRRRMLV